MAEPSENKEQGNEPAELPDFVKAELQTMTSTERAAVLMLLMGETQAADIIKYMSPREVQALGSSMVGVVDLSQETVSAVLDDFVSTIKQQTNQPGVARLCMQSGLRLCRHFLGVSVCSLRRLGSLLCRSGLLFLGPRGQPWVSLGSFGVSGLLSGPLGRLGSEGKKLCAALRVFEMQLRNQSTFSRGWDSWSAD